MMYLIDLLTVVKAEILSALPSKGHIFIDLGLTICSGVGSRLMASEVQ